MNASQPLTSFTVSLSCGTFTVQARSLLAAILRAQADALDDGVLDAPLSPLSISAPGLEAGRTGETQAGSIASSELCVTSPPEKPLSAHELRRKLGEYHGRKTMGQVTLNRAIREKGLPCHQSQFGHGRIFFWSEVLQWLKQPEPEPAPKPVPLYMQPEKRQRGRPRKTLPPTGKPRWKTPKE